MIAATYLSAAHTAGALLRAPRLASRWDEPSALASFPVSGLAGHLARAVFTVERALDAQPPAGPPMDAPTYFHRTADADPADLDAPTNQAVRVRGQQEAAAGPNALAERYFAALERLAPRLADTPPDRPVLMFGRHPLTLDACLRTRIVELVVRADDLAISLDLPTPDFGPDAAGIAVATLAEVARRRHGTTALIRALARRERAAGPIAAF